MSRNADLPGKSEAQIHLSAAESGIVGINGIDPNTPVHPIHKAAVVGAGIMGTGIAMAYANAGIPVLLKEVSQELLDSAIAGIRKNYESSFQKGRLTETQAMQRIDLIRPALSYEGFPDVDIALEAVYESLQLKKQIFAELSAVCKPEAILATNTSALDIDAIAAATTAPFRVIGHHFFAPANVMRLMEIVRGRATSNEVIASSLALAGRLNKIGVVVGNCRGFAGNRMYYQYQREAQFLVEEGAQVQEVDDALRKFGMAMGPFAVRDLSGLDVAWRIQSESSETGPPAIRRPLVLGRLFELGRFGQKSGAGWYRYKANSREPLPDPEVQKIIENCACEAGIRRRAIKPEEIVERTLYALVNEGARILEEGIVQRAAALDIIFAAGYGFPAFRGGPMWFADEAGLSTIYHRICEFEQRHGRHWTPAGLLRQLAEQGGSFSKFDEQRMSLTSIPKLSQ